MSRPYFETKVVKVRKPYCNLHKSLYCLDICCKEFWGCEVVEKNRKERLKEREKNLKDLKMTKGTICPCCGLIKIDKKPKEKKGNWVNEENLDKIKFPCFCSFKSEKYLGEETKGKMESHNGIIHINGGDFYELFCIDKQDKWDFIDSCTILKNLISSYDIHILKGKIIIYEEE